MPKLTTGTRSRFVSLSFVRLSFVRLRFVRLSWREEEGAAGGWAGRAGCPQSKIRALHRDVGHEKKNITTKRMRVTSQSPALLPPFRPPIIYGLDAGISFLHRCEISI
jgi:hypothetical protein